MSGTRVALTFAAGCVVGIYALAVTYAEHYFRTCENTSTDGFACSNCKSHTAYVPKVPYRFCPMCGAYVTNIGCDV